MIETKQKILIVDDEPDVVEFLSYNFKKNGYETIGAQNGVDGINKVKEILPDLIIADIMMPIMNGITMCKILKSDSVSAHIPIVFLSAAQDDYLVMNAGISGAEQFVSKPVKFPRLLNIVQEYL